jgi:hypothetical protein
VNIEKLNPDGGAAAPQSLMFRRHTRKYTKIPLVMVFSEQLLMSLRDTRRRMKRHSRYATVVAS